MIHIDRVTAWYNNVKVLSDVSIDFPENSITAIIGPSGCGKSTLLRMINRINDFNKFFKFEGKIFINDVDIYHPTISVEELRSDIGMIFQAASPFNMSIFDNVAYGLKIQGERNKNVIADKVEYILKKTYLWNEVNELLKESANMLSGGQKQRLCLARMLAIDPKVILLDEPASALDPISTGKIEELILELKREHTILLVTHNLAQATRISDYTPFFYLGKLMEYQNTKAMFINPKYEFTQNYNTGRFG